MGSLLSEIAEGCMCLVSMNTFRWIWSYIFPESSWIHCPNFITLKWLQILPPPRNAQTWTPASATQSSPESTARWELSSQKMEHYNHRQHHPDYHEHHLQVRQSWTPPTQFLPSPGPTKAKAGRTFYLLSATLTPKSQGWQNWCDGRQIRKSWQTDHTVTEAYLFTNFSTGGCSKHPNRVKITELTYSVLRPRRWGSHHVASNHT